MPVISDAQVANNLTIQAGATLTISGTGARLNLFGTITNNGTLTNSGGTVGLFGTTAQSLPAGTYSKVQVNNASGVSLSGNTTISDSLILTAGILNLNAHVLTLDNNAYASAGNAGSYIRNNSTGNVVVNNVGTGGKSGSVIIPVGNSTYNPVVLNNAGVADNFTVWVIDSVTNTYSGSNPVGAAFTTNVVNRTWIINEAVAGGSNSTVTLQWDAANETPGFNRSNAYVSRFNGVSWNGNTASPASGTNPYTLARTGITSFSPFGVASGGVLPVELLTFNATKARRNVDVSWSTASEKNSSHFMVERSSDGMTFETVSAKIKSAGNSNTLQSYTFTDINAAEFANRNNDVIYYRLKQVDIDGTYEYSDLVAVVFNEDIEIVTGALPNPFTEKLLAVVSTKTGCIAEIRLTDAMGKTIQSFNVFCNAGDNKIEIPGVEQLYSGVYFLSITLDDNTFVHRVVHNK
jgi:hypothetical protein